MKKYFFMLAIILAGTVLQNNSQEPSPTTRFNKRMQQPAQCKKFKAEALKQAEKQALDRSLREQNIKFNSFYLQQLTRQHNPGLKAEYERQEQATATKNLQGHLELLEEMKKAEPLLVNADWSAVQKELQNGADVFVQNRKTQKTSLEMLLNLDNQIAQNITLKTIMDNDQETNALKIIQDPERLGFFTVARIIPPLIASLELKKIQEEQEMRQRRRRILRTLFATKK